MVWYVLVKISIAEKIKSNDKCVTFVTFYYKSSNYKICG